MIDERKASSYKRLLRFNLSSEEVNCGTALCCVLL